MVCLYAFSLEVVLLSTHLLGFLAERVSRVAYGHLLLGGQVAEACTLEQYVCEHG